MHVHIYIYDAGLPHPRSPPHPMVSPLACQVGSCLVWPCYVPRLVLIGLVPSPPLWSGACGLFGWPRPACGGQCVLQRFYRGMVWLLPLVSSTVIVTGPVVVLVGPAPPVWGSVFYRDMVWLLPLVSSNVIVTCSLRYKKYDVALFSWQTVPLSLL